MKRIDGQMTLSTRHARFLRSGSRVLGIALAFAWTGCNQSVDLDAVRSLAASAVSSQASFDSVAQDYGDTCVRRNIYQTIGSAVEANFPRTPHNATKQALDRAAAAVAAADIAVLRGQPDAMHPCELEQKAARDWQSANGVVIAYFVALGKLAGGAPSGDTYGVKALAVQVVATKGFSSSQASSIGDFANVALDQIYEAKRRGALAEYIPQADAALGRAITTLEGLASDDYTNALGRERVVANRFFERNLQLAQPGEQAFEVLSYADAWSQRTQEIDDRAAAAQAYVLAWETLRTNHAQLLTAISKNDTASALAIGKAIYAAIAPDIMTMDKAFRKGI